MRLYGSELVQDVHFRVTFSNGRSTVRNAGNYSIKSIDGIGAYNGSVKLTGKDTSFKVAFAKWEDLTPETSVFEWHENLWRELSGKQPQLYIDGNPLIPYSSGSMGYDYKVNGGGQVRFIGETYWSIEDLFSVTKPSKYPHLSFKIVGNMKDAVIEDVPSQRYTGSAVTPKPKIKHPGKYEDGGVLVEGKDYTLDYKNNVDAGTATITITGTGLFKGTRTLSFQIASPWKRLGGKNAVGTMAKIVGEGFSQASTVVVATSGTYKDALSAAALAGAKSAPILLVNRDSIPSATKGEIERLAPKNAIIVGGTSAVSDAVASQLRTLGCSVSRVAGANASDTSRAVARKVGNTMGTVIIATSADFADALSIAPWAYAKKAPIILTEGSGKLAVKSVNLIKSLGFTRAVIVGGTSAVDSSADAALVDAGLSVIRLAGKSATDTSKEVALWELKEGFSLANVAVATRTSYKDALTGSALMGKLGGPIVLVNGESYGAVNAVIKGKVAQIEQGYFFGGTAVVSKDVAAKIQAIK